MLLVDHGSLLPEANILLEQTARSVRNHADGIYVAVEPAHMELAEPSVKIAFDRCVAAGARKVIVSLFFLSPGRHSQQDIPRLVSDAASHHPDVTWSMTDPLGSDPAITELLLRQARATP
ncbi:MAG: cobalamin biosynthesis protein CbiX [Verrucomicrobia bacterium]|nr:cobalamin biosynthesis protein CbiX [Verrucomicrobiota bacterium]